MINWRDKINARVVFWTKVIGLPTAVLLFVTAYAASGLPRPALDSEVVAAETRVHTRIAGLEKFSTGTRGILLGQDWDRWESKRKRYQTKLNADPGNTDLQDLVDNAEAQLRRIERQLDELKQ